MENATPRDPGGLDAELRAAEDARTRLVGQLRLPTGHHTMLAVAVAIQIGTAGVGIARQSIAGLGLVGAGLLTFAGLAAVILWRFRRLNGASIGGLTSRAVLGTSNLSSLVYGSALAAATWASFEAEWWLVGLAAVAGGVGYAAAARRWWAAYLRDAAAHARGDSPPVLVVLAVLACIGAALLLVVG